MTTYMLIFAAALLTTLIGVPYVRRLAIAAGFVDQPAARKVHQVPVPLLGGAAIWLGCILALFAFTDRFNLPQLGAILLGATICAAVGLVDDRLGLGPLVKMGGQVVAAIVLIVGGVFVQSLTPWEPVNFVVTLVWVVGITNAMNLLDNMDGLAAGVAAIASGFFLILAAGSGQYLVASLAAALFGAALGFLRFNFIAPARIFMGDAGSLFIGFVLAALGIKLQFQNEPVVTWLIPVLVLGVPVFDTSLVIVSRLRRGLNPLTAAGKDHFSHRLTLVGLTKREAVMVIYLIAVLLGLTASFLRNASVIEAAIIGALVAATAIYGIVRLEWVFHTKRPTTPVTSIPTESALAAADTTASVSPTVVGGPSGEASVAR